MKKLTALAASLLLFAAPKAQPATTLDEQDLPVAAIAIPTAGNTWIKPSRENERFNGNITDWKNANTSYTSYFRTNQTGLVTVRLHVKAGGGQAALTLALDKKPFPVLLKNQEWETVYGGAWILKDTGYHALQLTIAKKDSVAAIAIDSIYISGSATAGDVVFVPNNEGNFYYWGRRGPSVHLNYPTAEKEVEWFYNEVTVPVGSDPVGSYFMADGFSVGYFGFQVNGPDKRHVLFSVWSPFSTDHPEEIPADKKITLLKKGENVHGGEFGGEGSGGQSYLVYPWKAGRTYRFLLHAQPHEADSTTDFTAYFFAPETNKWQLIASFRRPHTYTWLTQLHSFLENFNPEMGNISRQGNYGNQWIYTHDGKWIPLTQAIFTMDNTGRKNYRKDYGGGVQKGQFYLKNGGFFSQFTPYHSVFERNPSTDAAPKIDFEKLP